MLMQAELIKRSQNGDVAAFEELVAAYQKKAYNLAYRMMGNQHDAADMTQEALIKVYKSLRTFRGEASFSTWVYHIVANTCRDELRKQSRHRDTSLDASISFDDGECSREIADYSQCPEALYQSQELAAALQYLISTLQPEYRMIIVLREYAGLSYEEIASKLGISLGTVKSRLNRGRKYLQKKIMADSELYDNILRQTGKRRDE